MIRDYKSGSGFRGALGSLIGERVVAVQCVNNTITVFFHTRSAVSIRAHDRGILVIAPLNVDDVSAYIKQQVRAADEQRADLDRAINLLADCKGAENSGQIRFTEDSG